jgi:hypothetical protein
MADKCEAYRALIEEAAGGAGESRVLRAHLETCAACREFRLGREALVGLLGGLGRVSAPDDFEFRLRARMAARRSAERAPLWRLRLVPGLTAAAVAACLLVAASVYFRINQTAEKSVAMQDSPPATAPTEGVAETVQNPISVADVSAPPAAVAQGRTQDAPRGRVSAASVGKRSADKPRRAMREDSFSARGASVIEGGVSRPLVSGAESRGVPLRTSPETLRVVLRDERGGSYVLPMRSFSFGSQAPVGRGVRATRASYTDREGVW